MDGGLCGCEVLGCGSDVGDAPGDDGVGEQGDSFALDVLAAGVSAAALSLVRRRETASLVSAISCSTDVATSFGYALELFGALSLQSLRIAITTAGGRSLHQDSDPLYSLRHSTSGVVRIRRDAPTRSPRRRPPCCRTTRNRYISSTYSVNPWIRDESLEDVDNLPPPAVLAAQIADHLQSALAEIQALTEALSGRAPELELTNVSVSTHRANLDDAPGRTKL